MYWQHLFSRSHLFITHELVHRVSWLVGHMDVTQSWVSPGLLPAVGMARDRGCSVVLSHDTQPLAAELTLDILAVFLQQPLHHPRVAVLTQLFAIRSGELTQPGHCSPVPHTQPQAGSLPCSLVWLTTGSAEAAEHSGCLQGTEGRSKPLHCHCPTPYSYKPQSTNRCKY